MPSELTGLIKKRLSDLGISEREASRRAGLGLSYIGDLVHDRIKAPTLPKLEKIAGALECDVEYLMGRQEELRGTEGRTFAGPFDSATGSQRLIDLYASPSLNQNLWVPVTPGAVDKVQVIPPLANVQGAYAWSIANRLMEPRYYPGEVAYINPTLRAKEGDFVFVRRTNGEVTVAQLEAFCEDRIKLCYLRKNETISVPMDDIETIHRIVGSAG